MKKYRIICIIALAALLLYILTGERTEAAEVMVEVPENLNFYLDPGNINEKGQIYSQKYKIRNVGKGNVIFSIEMALSMLEKSEVIDFCPKKWKTEPAEKSIFMYVIFEGNWGKDKIILTDTGILCQKSMVLEPAGTDGDTISISFGGMLSQSEQWKSGELAINAIYELSTESMEHQVTIDGEHLQIKDGTEKILEGEKVEFYLVPDEGYFLPSEVQVYMNEKESGVLYESSTGKIILEDVTGDVSVCANGIPKAKLPEPEVMDIEKAVWSWTAEDGVQAYEYHFLLDGEMAVEGRIDVAEGSVNWNWSEGLEDGNYELRLKAIGDTVNCLNSEEGSYPVLIDRTVLHIVEE